MQTAPFAFALGVYMGNILFHFYALFYIIKWTHTRLRINENLYESRVDVYSSCSSYLYALFMTIIQKYQYFVADTHLLYKINKCPPHLNLSCQTTEVLS